MSKCSDSEFSGAMIEKIISTSLPSGDEKSIAFTSLRKITLVLFTDSILACGIATPFPTPVEPSLSRSFNFSLIKFVSFESSLTKILEIFLKRFFYYLSQLRCRYFFLK